MSSLLREQRGQVWLLTIDGEAQMNVLSRGLVVELRDTAIAAASDPDVRAVVITGAGDRAFCAGANLKERAGWSDDDVRRWLVELHEGLRAIERCGPTATLLEWDDNIPSFDEVHAEALKANRYLQRASRATMLPVALDEKSHALETR